MNEDFRVLIYPKPTELDRSGSQYLYWRDSNLLFVQSIIDALPSNYLFHWLVPESLPGSAMAWFIRNRRNIKIASYPFLKDVDIDCYHFDARAFSYQFKDADIDFIFNFQTAQTIALSNTFGKLGQRPIIFNFYDRVTRLKMDLELANSHSANILCFKTATSIERFSEYAKRFDYLGIESRSVVVSPPANTWGESEYPDFHPNKKVIVLNSRFDEQSENMRVLDAFKTIYENRKDFVVRVTDENCPFEVIENISRYPFVIIENVRPEVYGSFLKKAHAAVCLDRDWESWQMAIRDCIANECFVLVDLKTAMNMNAEKMGAVGSLVQNLEILLDTPRSVLKAYAKLMLEKGVTLGNLSEIRQHMVRVYTKSAERLFSKDIEELIKRVQRKDFVTRFQVDSILKELNIPMDATSARRIFLTKTKIRDDTSSPTAAYHSRPDYVPIAKRYTDQPLFKEY